MWHYKLQILSNLVLCHQFPYPTGRHVKAQGLVRLRRTTQAQMNESKALVDFYIPTCLPAGRDYARFVDLGELLLF